MKDIRAPFRAILLADPTVASLCGGRIYPERMQQGQRSPSLVYNIRTEFSDYHLAGDSGLQQTTIQLDAFATTPDAAAELAGAAHDALTGFRGTIDGVVIHSIQQGNGRALFDEQAALSNMSRDWTVWYAER